MSPLNLLVSTCVAFLLTIITVDGIAVLSVDFGSEWMKIGIVSPGVPMEIVLNKESKRKTPTIISYRDNQRTFGEDAQTIGLRFPKSSYAYLLDLLGKDINNPIVKLYQKRFPHYELVEDPERGTIQFKHEDNVFYSPEELIAQLLREARIYAESSVDQPVNECVLTVPGFFNQIERKAMLQAAHLAGLKVLQLINDYSAVALNYGIFRRKNFNETAHYIMFYDMGASSTTASIVSYQLVKTKDRGIVETQPQITVLGVGYDRSLGGLEIQLRLRDYLAKKFNEMKKTKNDVFKNPRAMAKLFKEAGRLKNVLSANAEHVAQVEGLLDDHDFRLHVNREQLEQLCEDLFKRVAYPAQQALKTAHLTLDVITQVVLVGAGTRVPRIQDELQKVVGMELSKNLNTDEAAAMGAVYKAADLSTGFKVKKFIIKDAVLFPVQITFERHDSESPKETKEVKRTLFGLMNPYPQKKVITFNKHTTDFSFNVNYADLAYLTSEEIAGIGSQNLTIVNLEGVEEILNKNKAEHVESKGIKAHFAMDESGVLSLAGVEFVFEKTAVPEETSENEESPLSKLGNTISKLFSSSGDDKEAETPLPLATEETTTPETNTTSPPSNVTNETLKVNATGSKKEKDTKPKVTVLKEPVQTKEKILSLQQMSPEQLEQSFKKLEALNEVDMQRNRRESALNNLESFVIDTLSKLDTDEFVSSGTETEIEGIRTMCNQISDWLYDEGSDADAVTYEQKISELHSLTKDLYQRVFEHKERPEALKALDKMLIDATAFWNNARNMTKTTNPEKDVFTDVETETLEKLIKVTIEWKNRTLAKQEKLKRSEPVVLTVKSVAEKMAALDREVKYLINKLKFWRPKKVEKPVKEDTNASEKEEQVIKPETSEGEEKVEEEVLLPVPETQSQEEQDDVKIEPTSTKDKAEEDSHSEL